APHPHRRPQGNSVRRRRARGPSAVGAAGAGARGGAQPGGDVLPNRRRHNLALASVGGGAPLIKVANWLTHSHYGWECPIWSPLLQHLAQHWRLIRYDGRGNGLADREVADISFSAFVRDLATVVDAAGLERSALLGISQGAAVAIAYAVQHPERVSKL